MNLGRCIGADLEKHLLEVPLAGAVTRQIEDAFNTQVNSSWYTCVLNYHYVKTIQSLFKNMLILISSQYYMRFHTAKSCWWFTSSQIEIYARAYFQFASVDLDLIEFGNSL